jgi:hypothetical protein
MMTFDPIPVAEKNAYHENGYLVVRNLFTEDECDFWANYFTDMVERGGDGWAEGGVDPSHEDPLKRYPRLLQPHRGDKVAFDYMIDPRIMIENLWQFRPWCISSRQEPGVRRFTKTIVTFKPSLELAWQLG